MRLTIPHDGTFAFGQRVVQNVPAMGEAAVREILRRIDEFSATDRLLLESRLAERAELEWVEAEAARAVARERGIDQDTIDRAVEEVRYPSPAATR